MTKNFPNQKKEIDIQVEEWQRVPKTIENNPKQVMSKKKMEKGKDKEKTKGRKKKKKKKKES